MGDSIVITHYSCIKPINGEIIRGKIGEFITAKLFCSNTGSLQRGDPIVLGTLDPREGDGIKYLGGNIVDSYKSQNLVLISPDKIYSDVEKRQFTRHKVSLVGYIRSNINKNVEIKIKDISYAGIGIFSDIDIDLNSAVTIDLYLEEKLLTNDGVIVRKSISFGKNEYGIQLLHRDKQSIYYAQQCIDTYMDREVKLLRKSLEQRKFGLENSD